MTVFFFLMYACIHFYDTRHFLQGLGTDEETLMEILSTRTGKQLQDISAAYHYCKTPINQQCPVWLLWSL